MEGGGVAATMDYARFCQMLLNGGHLDGVRILSPATVRLMTSDHLGRIAEAGPAPTAGLTYVKDIAPIMSSDCLVCHGPTRRDAGYDFSAYAGVMKAVSSTTSNAKLVRVTQPGGLMYSQFKSNGAAKAKTIYDWVVTYKAGQQ